MRLLFHSLLERVVVAAVVVCVLVRGWGGGVHLKLDVQDQGCGNNLNIDRQGGGGGGSPCKFIPRQQYPDSFPDVILSKKSCIQAIFWI